MADFLIARVERAIVPDEPEHLGRRLADVLDLEFQLPRLGRTLARALAQGVAGVGNAVQRALQQRVEVALINQLAAHLHNHGRMLDTYRASTLGRASPSFGKVSRPQI